MDGDRSLIGACACLLEVVGKVMYVLRESRSSPS